MRAHNKGVLLLIAVVLIQFAYAYKQDLTVKDDSRNQFFIENFGYKAEGVFSMNVSYFQVKSRNTKEDVKYEDYRDGVYFLQRVSYTDSSEFLTDVDLGCASSQASNSLNSGSYINNIPPRDWAKDYYYETKIDGANGEGFYNLYFVNCNHSKYSVSFKLHLEEYNFDGGVRDYLPVGLSPLPSIYGIFSVTYVIMFFIWIFGYMRAPGTVLNKVHYLMAVLVVLKFLSMLFYAIEQYHIKLNGKPGGWATAYYVFAVLKTSFFFVIVTLIGTGWSFFKPFLSDKDKKIIMVVIPLQILDNIAMIYVNVDDPGSQNWFTWKDIFRLVDIICCGAVLIPIIWSIKHLREASQSDGKAARNLQKLHLFRQFYLIVVSYIYFTRIIVYLLDATLQYYLMWLGDVFTEAATLTFFVVVGYKFRPVSGNPYFKMEEEDAIRMEEMRNAELEND